MNQMYKPSSAIVGISRSNSVCQPISVEYVMGTCKPDANHSLIDEPLLQQPLSQTCPPTLGVGAVFKRFPKLTLPRAGVLTANLPRMQRKQY